MRHREVVWTCRCYKCWDCKESKLVLWPYYRFSINAYHNVEMERIDVPMCFNCGKPAQRGNKTYFDLKHTKFCLTRWQNASACEIKNSDIAFGLNILNYPFENDAQELLKIAEMNNKLLWGDDAAGCKG